MIVVLASRRDAAARWLVKTWGAERARLLTVDDLSTPGWRIRTADLADSRAIAQGTALDTADLTGVLTRLPAVTPQEVRLVRPEDRDYAASEMSAFLNYWLSTLTCTVLNPPVTSSLCGPGWRSEQWVVTARRLGMPARTRSRHVPPHALGQVVVPADPGLSVATEDRLELTVVGDRCIGDGDETLAASARALAACAGVPMLTVLFERSGTGIRFVDAHPWANLFDPQINQALLDYFDSVRVGR